MIVCNGEGWNGDHCCYVRGEVCPYLVENRAGRRYACGLLIKYGSWDKVNASPEYQWVGERWTEEPTILPWNYCEVFSPAFCCRPELRDGRSNDAAELLELG